ncbi:hypothetical protein C0992_013084 [Termitomyces sp. T32_za158]|nr:hypothetical protein C0992_013084 [Termitomyces sp. T32_za158]
MASRKVAKTAPHQEETPPVAGPSWQIIPVDPVKPVLCPGSVVLSDLESPSGAKVQPNYVPLPTPCVDGQEFLWLGQALDYPISALCPSEYIEAAKEKAAGMAEVMQKNVRVAVTEMEGLHLRKKIMERSVDILERYQANCAEALEWRVANKTHLQQPFATLFPLPPGASSDP